ncbi:O-methyltransferase [Streptomyces sp. ID05-04B]|uniref:O-methyltransferase n=1 Tax=unclassified Streptomyces TaxID=2593676 RepID=UPI000D1A4C07|nr:MULTISPECIES: O-methyltransferase [unclassified Streptomyces]AVV41760.1 methyltransferase [Streptomyces sp. P3]MDX5568721.1 O-methyltransferase [Streptomyces sp. ID05-04B]
MQQTWTAVDAYFNDLLVEEDDALRAAGEGSVAAGLPPHQVAPNQGKLLHLIARLRGARTILEIGTLGGYSTLWLARALPEGGRLVTLESDERHAETAAANIARAGYEGVVDLRVGKASDTLPLLAAELGDEGFDLVFIDADKPSNPLYLEWALRLTRPGSVIVGDNVVREGAVTDAASTDPRVQGVRTFTELISQHPKLTATAVQTVGEKGYDGFVLALVTD